jgi:hypothetical protein
VKGKRFNHILENRLESVKKTLATKSDEYSTEEDKLHNFKRGEEISGQPREKVLLGFLLKHQISILDMVDKIVYGKLPSLKLIDEKFTDTIGYYALLEVMIVERIEEQK